jgi:hypothetical protein
MKVAIRWYYKAAVAGSAVACYLVGSSYEEGKEVAEDSEKAALWFLHSAARGDSDALRKLARPGQCGLVLRVAVGLDNRSAMELLLALKQFNMHESIAGEEDTLVLEYALACCCIVASRVLLRAFLPAAAAGQSEAILQVSRALLRHPNQCVLVLQTAIDLNDKSVINFLASLKDMDMNVTVQNTPSVGPHRYCNLFFPALFR